MPVPSPTYASPFVIDTTDTNHILTTVEGLFQPGASSEKQLLGNVIRILARYIQYAPVCAQEPDLPILLAVSVALERSRAAAK
jgi:hypothetical protein